MTAEDLVSGQIVTVKSLILTSVYDEATTGSVCQKSLEEVFPPQAIYQSKVIYLTFLRGGEVIAGKYLSRVYLITLVNNPTRNTRRTKKVGRRESEQEDDEMFLLNYVMF